MRQLENATPEELVRAMRAARTMLHVELAGQYGFCTVPAIDVERCLAVIKVYEESSGVTQTELRTLIADIKEGRKRGC